MKERIERKHPNKTGEEITVISRGYTVDLLANHLADLDEFRVKFNSTDVRSFNNPSKPPSALEKETQGSWNNR